MGSACPRWIAKGPAPGDGLVRARGVVFDAVVLSSLDQRQCVGDVAWEQAFVLQRSEPASPGTRSGVVSAPVCGRVAVQGER